MKRNRFKVVDISKNTAFHLKRLGTDADWFVENSAIIGDNEIVLGFYKNPRLKRFAFLHELGHSLDRVKHRNKYESEKEAWRIARVLAKHLDIKIGKLEWKYIRECLNTYKK